MPNASTATSLNVAVLGAGRMGQGIAYAVAAANHTASVYDPFEEALAKTEEQFGAMAELLGHDGSAKRRLRTSQDLSQVVRNADLVIEAVPEKLALKQQLFAQVEEHAPATAILASNTSAIPIAEIAANLKDRARMIGAHFWNPPHLVRLVEVVQSDPASGPAIARAMEILRGCGWVPVHVKRDIPGFVGNRMQHALKREAIALVAAGVCDAETIDTVVKLGFGSRLGVLGPLEQSDLVGLELTKNIHDVLIPDLDVTPHTHPYLDQLVAAGHLGMKTGKGFREWTPETAKAVRDRLDQFLVQQARNLKSRKAP
jgi:3-hydroxybutyryl-CoA dehydrogenase